MNPTKRRLIRGRAYEPRSNHVMPGYSTCELPDRDTGAQSVYHGLCRQINDRAGRVNIRRSPARFYRFL